MNDIEELAWVFNMSEEEVEDMLLDMEMMKESD